ncbi:MAG TPA: TIGR04053 family radical SAM/SPASM domain-containing protein [Patescibacteria group bacterium]|jgi:radical SAM protein|nr:TIGR04053 family radical SAM/SPASM domain-containing protein [Patescibacteria group bacterium]
MPMLPQLDYKQAPFLIIWETTQACDLACRHCRASAQPEQDSLELSTEEGKHLLRQASRMGTPIFILSGGDPLKRKDLFQLIRYGADLGLRMATIPAATDRLTEEVVIRLKEAGCSQMAQSLDFPTAELHDAFRGVPGAFARTMKAIEWAHKHQLPLQINTTLCEESARHIDRMIDLVETLGVVFWEVFFLVPMGRGQKLGGLTAVECERLFEKLYQVQKRNDFLVKVTEAPHYRRYAVQREAKLAAGGIAPGGVGKLELPERLTRTEGPGHTIGLASQGVNSGNGFLFVSHRGEVFPSGFLPLAAGNIRHQRLDYIYRHSPIFRQLRTPEDFHGVCGDCEYRSLCGGSRSRAYALTGDYLASDPWCVYRPKPRESAA